jgi:hypothetical protein
MHDRDLKRGSTEMLIMAMVEERPRDLVGGINPA